MENAIAARPHGPSKLTSLAMFSGKYFVLAFNVPLSILSSFFLLLLLIHTPSSHCDACKLIGGGCEYTMNALVDKSDFKTTKGDFKTYVYRGDSGTFRFYLPFSSFLPLRINRGEGAPSLLLTTIPTLLHPANHNCVSFGDRQRRNMLLLSNMHEPCFPPSSQHGAG